MGIQQTDRKFALTIYENSKNTKGRQTSSTYPQLVGLLKKRIIREQKDGLAFSPYRLKEGTTRANGNVQFVSLAVADIDDGTSLDTLRLAIGDYTWLAVSSHSHTEGTPKYRLVFPLTRDVTPDEWAKFREGFAALLDGHVDPATKDLARFYYWPSCPEAQKELAFFIENEGCWLDPDLLIPREATVASPFTPTLDAVGTSYPSASLEAVSARCAQVRRMKETLGDVSYEHWRGVIGIGKFCTDGEAKVVEWSARREETGHTNTDALSKLASWDSGPTTCDYFRNRCDPDVCAGCAFAGTSPIQLGSVISETPITPVVEVEGEKEWSPAIWSKAFIVMNNRLFGQEKDADGNVDNVCFADPAFYPVEWVVGEDGTYGLRCRVSYRPGRWSFFHIPFKNCVDGKSLRLALGAYAVAVHNDKLAVKFMKSMMADLRHARDAQLTYQQFGWHHDFSGFLIGDHLITKDSVQHISTTLSNLSMLHETKGTAQEWIDGVDTLFNRPNMEPYQYVFATVFGSVLVPMLKNDRWHGIPLALTSEDSGYGKSTVSCIAINALYHASTAFLPNITPKAVVSRASKMNNLIMLVDEVTRSMPEPRHLSDIAYDLSNGGDKIRLLPNGQEAPSSPRFRGNHILTGNQNVFGKLTENPQNPEALQMRVFEIDLPAYYNNKPPINAAKESSIAINLDSNVYGVLLIPYLRYVMDHVEEIQENLQKFFDKIMTVLDDTANKERFYGAHIACSLLGLKIAIELGFVKFDFNSVKKFAINHVVKLRKLAQEYKVTNEDILSMFLADIHGHILVTRNYDTLDSRDNGKTEVPQIQLRGAPLARLVLGTSAERGKLFISVRAFDEWCVEHNHNANTLKRNMRADGIIRTNRDGKNLDAKIGLSKGVPTHPTGRCRCLEVDYSFAQGYIKDFVENENVVEFKPTTPPPQVEQAPEPEAHAAAD